MNICEYCDGGHHTDDHKTLGQIIVEDAFANSQLPDDEQSPVHFRGYYPEAHDFCYDSKAAKTVAHFALQMYQEVVNCDKCIDIANAELKVYRENCYCSNCSTKRKEGSI